MLMQVMKNTGEISNAEKGCLMYKFHADYKDSNVFWLTESWATVMDLKNHGTRLSIKFPLRLSSNWQFQFNYFSRTILS